MHIDAVNKGDKVVIVDDLLATGGTVNCTVDMVKQLGGNLAGAVFLVELSDLNGRTVLQDSGLNVFSVVEI